MKNSLGVLLFTKLFAAVGMAILLAALAMSTASAATLPTPMAYWQMEGTSTDTVGSHNGSDTFGVTYGTGAGKIEQGASYNGGLNGGRTAVDSADWEFGTGDFTISLWANPQDTSSGGSWGETLFLARNSAGR
jgi:poly(3-hydroxybutyrate) depolymerase